MSTSAAKLRLILGDQLNPRHSWFREKNEDVVYIIAELKQELSYTKHHIQKICAFLAAMEQFASALKKAGHRVEYLQLNETQQDRDLPALLRRLCEKYKAQHFEYQQPDEFRLAEQLHKMQLPDIEKQACSSEHFLLAKEELDAHIQPGKHQRLEFFYRHMRQRTGYLINQDGEPEGGQWNYDQQNRNSLKKKDLQEIPEPLKFENDVSALLDRLQQHQVKFIGKAEHKLNWPITRRQSQKLLKHFCEKQLSHFGQFQDAMTDSSPHGWVIYHSRLSFSLNTKMLPPSEVIEAAMKAWQENAACSLAQIEGFIRQILGWREYVRAIYWQNMPDYAHRNKLLAQRNLPSYFWDGKTKMHCLHCCISQSLNTAYAHHIQRLMVTGNFCLLTGIHPDQVDSWYLGIYADAVEWVEMPNTRGMSQFADGGLIATKPYAASGSYINRMSDYCKNCHYDVKQKSTVEACPFNSLYWHFINRHQDRLNRLPRMNPMLINWQKQDETKQQAILQRGQWCLDHIDTL